MDEVYINEFEFRCEYLSNLEDVFKIHTELIQMTNDFHISLKTENWNKRQQQHFQLLYNLLNDLSMRIKKMILLSESRETVQRLNELQNLIQREQFRLQSSLGIVSQQPSQILRFNQTFDLTFQCPYLDEDQAEVNCYLISGSQFKDIQQNWHLNQSMPNLGNLENSCAILKLDQNGQRSAKFENLKLKRNTTKFSLAEKFSFFFYTTILIDNQSIRIWSMSQPIVVISHYNQECLAQSTIWWDNAFPESPRDFFAVRETVNCHELIEELANYAHNYTRHPLNDLHKAFITKKLQVIASGDLISFEQFCRKSLPGQIFSFWEWFYNIMKVLKPKYTNHDGYYYINLDNSVHNLWERDLIAGFISKQQAHEMLQKQPIGTLLLRFSESQNGSLGVVYKNASDSIVMYTPWDQRQLKQINIAAAIGQLKDAKYLYSPPEGVRQLHHVLYSFHKHLKLRTPKSNTSLPTWHSNIV